MQHAEHDNNLKNVLLTTGVLALATTALAWFLKDEKNRDKIKDGYQKAKDKTMEYVETIEEKNNSHMQI